MKQLKVFLALAGFIAIGFLAGFYTHRYVSTQKIERVARMRSAEGFREAFFQRIEASPGQREQLAPIIDRYSQAMGRSHRDWRRSMRSLVDSMHQEVMPLLDEGQRAELQRFNRRFGGDRDGDGDRSRKGDRDGDGDRSRKGGRDRSQENDRSRKGDPGRVSDGEQ